MGFVCIKFSFIKLYQVTAALYLDCYLNCYSVNLSTHLADRLTLNLTIFNSALA